MRDRIDVPHWGWWALIVPPLTLLGFLALHDPTYAAWRANVSLPFTQPIYVGLLVVAIALHVGEAVFAYRLARTTDESPRAVPWMLQTLVLGFPSLRLLLARVRRAAIA